MACTAAMRFCVSPSTRSIAQSSRWRCAKSRAATATATADSSAVSSATRLRNCCARSTVWVISGRPVDRFSTRMPRSPSSLIFALAQSANAAALLVAVGRPRPAAT